VTSLRRPALRTVTRICGWAVVANIVLVVTGALVRLTGSGLGCPTWPRCTSGSYVVSPAAGIHGFVEFGNRTLTFALTAVVVLCLVATSAARPRRRVLVGLSWALLGSIVAQAVLGGIVVLADLNPYLVAGHFLLSMGAIAVAVVLHTRSREYDGPASLVIRPELAWLVRAIVAVGGLVLTLGTIVTGSGPHAGDPRSPRTGLDPQMISQLHADAVMLLVGLSVATWVALLATGAPRRVRRLAGLLVAVEASQAALGYLQYFTGVPAPLVAGHVLGAALMWATMWYLVLSVRLRAPAGVPAQQSAAATAVPA